MHILADASYVDRLSSKSSRLARLLASGPADSGIFEEFYLAALDRPPAPEETTELQAILAKREDREAALREFVRALTSSREFAENH